jgi:ribosomal protein S6--L-glutamate ligase
VKILILSRKRSLYSTKRLREEGERLGHKVDVVDPLKIVLRLSEGKPSMLVGARMLQSPGVVLPRIGTAGTIYSIAVVRHFELMGVPVVNRASAIEQAKNKLDCLQVLARKGIPVPDTLMSRYPRDLDKLMKLVGGPPLILKLLRGTQGTGVIFAESKASVESMLETIWSLGEDIMIQRFIAESKGKDIRILVVNGEARAAMRRIGPEGEFRSNIHRGGVGEPVALTKAFERIAVKAAEAAGLSLAGVDVLESASGPMVIEVNASPGFEGLEEATKQNIAKLFVEAAARAARKKKK